MSDKSRDAFVLEIERIEKALTKTKSAYLKKDYAKAIRRMRRELDEYDKFHKRA